MQTQSSNTINGLSYTLENFREFREFREFSHHGKTFMSVYFYPMVNQQ